jgi:hypothetical protein
VDSIGFQPPTIPIKKIIPMKPEERERERNKPVTPATIIELIQGLSSVH